MTSTPGRVRSRGVSSHVVSNVPTRCLLQKLWVDHDMPVERMSGDNIETAHVIESLENLWQAGNIFIADALKLTEMTQEDLARKGDLIKTSGFQFLLRNGTTVISDRYGVLRDVLLNVTLDNLKKVPCGALPNHPRAQAASSPPLPSLRHGHYRLRSHSYRWALWHSCSSRLRRAY